jgi:hypothetical protein
MDLSKKQTKHEGQQFSVTGSNVLTTSRLSQCNTRLIVGINCVLHSLVVSSPFAEERITYDLRGTLRDNLGGCCRGVSKVMAFISGVWDTRCIQKAELYLFTSTFYFIDIHIL